jgi:uncharacterized phiE125 gp8 family phage protein
MAIKDATVVTLAEMRTFLNLPTTETGQDSLLEALLDGVNKAVEKYIGVALINTSYTEYYDGDGGNILFLRHYPVISVTSLVDGTTTISSDDYHLYSGEGYIILDGDYFEDDYQNIAITYTAGHGAARTNIPDDIKTAIKLWVSYIHKKDNVAFSQRFGEPVIVQEGAFNIPRDVAFILEPYRIKRLGAV